MKLITRWLRSLKSVIFSANCEKLTETERQHALIEPKAVHSEKKVQKTKTAKAVGRVLPRSNAEVGGITEIWLLFVHFSASIPSLQMLLCAICHFMKVLHRGKFAA